jgi:hypothetical protein
MSGIAVPQTAAVQKLLATKMRAEIFDDRDEESPLSRRFGVALII